MYLEHLIYTGALAILVGMLYINGTDKVPAWVILLGVILPDTDYIFSVIEESVFGHFPGWIQHGTFHNFTSLCIISILGAWVLVKYFKFNFNVTLICIYLGFLSHLIEDALVYTTAYAFLEPFSHQTWKTGILLATNDINFYHICLGSVNIYVVGILLLLAVITFRIWVQGFSWLDEVPHINDTITKLLFKLLRPSKTRFGEVATITQVETFNNWDP